MFLRILIGLMIRHFWASLFTLSASAIYFCSNGGEKNLYAARHYVRKDGSMLRWLFIAVAVSLLLMFAQHFGNGSIKDGLWAMWEWLTSKVASLWKGTAEVAKASKPVASSKKKTAEK